MAKFTVDTHLFRELGELLVGRDSTALVELIKNSYDADATEVTVYGENLGKPNGRILITDDGIGMTESTFRSGFLRIASRIKETGERRSPCFQRRYTGAKGVGRLAAQKLAWKLDLLSVPYEEVYGSDVDAVEASIDWRRIDQGETLDDDSIDDAIRVDPVDTDDEPGTQIELTGLRGKWTAAERTRVIHEVTTFQPPEVLVCLPSRLTSSKLLFDLPLVRDIKGTKDPGFEIALEGDFDVGEEYWKVVAEAADWILEIDSSNEKNIVSYLITPTKSLAKKYPHVEQHEFHKKDPSVDYVPSFHARILIRSGHATGSQENQRRWMTRSAGIRVYMEGFRVLPYGDSGDDWLEIDRDYARRDRKLSYLTNADLDLSRFGDEDTDFGLSALRNSSYYGAVFLTNEGASELSMLVNREGFIPDAAFMSMRQIVRVGIDLSVRARAYETHEDRLKRREERSIPKASTDIPPERMNLREAADSAKEKAIELARQSRTAAAAGDHKAAEKLILNAGREIERGTRLAGELISDRSIMQVLAGVGLQMAAFVHEMNALLGMVSAVEAAVKKTQKTCLLDNDSRTQLAKLSQSVGDLRRVVERQASYLKDVTSPDARRRRSRQILRDRFDAAMKLVQRAADKRGISIQNRIPEALKSPPMFPAELAVVFSNLLTNAIKASRKNGYVRAKGRQRPNGTIVLTIENTGARVSLKDSEKWFLPFKSTTVESDPTLGQGMGMGLPIVRNILEEYGATVAFVKPSSEFTTAVQIVFT
ncbi:sensor histidine kinase [Gimesia sp.]|uniref:sensor histidine kinase n=1 Tax=Gimesia sp. TaxID=2024833 RepID=UPI0032EB5D78